LTYSEQISNPANSTIRIVDMESNTKKHQFLPDPVQELNGNICRLCDLLEILLDSEAKEIKVQRKIKDEKKELSDLYKKVIS
tara:strand:- start:122 stop:367 length:246 start_codon:yes stop_codon:yes gene_type:complete